jgi:ribose transport system substrate-binding protein
MNKATQIRDPYLVKSVVHSAKILAAFRSAGEALSLKEVAQRSGLPKTMCFRLLYTLHRCGMVGKVGANLYQSALRPNKQKLWRLGYAAQGTDYQFSRVVSASLERAAQAEGIELIAVDNRYSAKIAQRNADLLVREKVDLVIEFQTDETVAPMVAAKYREAGIPMIAIDIPHPGATYYGANNYEAGLTGGRYLGRWVREHWDSELDEILLLELPRAGHLPQMRLTGLIAGFNITLPIAKNCRVTHLNGNGDFEPSFESIRRHLRTARSSRIAVGAINDLSAIGALRAFEEAGRVDGCAIVGQNASPEGRAELREPNTRLIGSVAFFPERYGPDLIKISSDILNHKVVPPAIFVAHKLVTPANLNHYYPNDSLTQAEIADHSHPNRAKD